MLRINLLPGYVSQRRLTKRLIFGFGAVLTAILVGLLAYAFVIQMPHKAKILADAQTAEDEKATTDKINAQAADLTSKIAPIKAKLDFVNAVHDYNKQWAALYDHLARYSSQANPKIIYSAASVNGSTMTINAYSPSIADIGRFLQVIYSEPGFNADYNNIAIDRLPGYPDALVDKYYLNGKLVGIGAAPAGAATAQGQASGFGGRPNGFGGPPQGYGGPPPGYNGGPPPGYNGGPPSGTGGQAGGNTAALGGFDAVTPIENIIALQMNPLASPAQQQRQRLRILSHIKVKHEPKGFAVTVTATLKKPLTPPTLPSSGGAAPGGAPPPGGPAGG